MPSVSLQCPSCGRHNDDPEKQCECGFINDSVVLAELENKSSDVVKSKSLRNIDAPKNSNAPKNNSPQKNNSHSKGVVIKEIDSWAFTFSPEDNCIHLGTPALKEFKLTLALEDVEELLENVYQVTDSQKTIRNLQLSGEALADLIEEVHRLIEEKRSKVPIKFDKAELNGLAELINKKLAE
jgi:hypothetical protein